MKIYYLYILSNKKHGNLQIDITDNIISTVKQLKDIIISASKNKKEECLLVYYESAGNVLSAIKYKKKLEKWDTVWKHILIESINPDWLDLYDDLMIHKDSESISFKKKISEKLKLNQYD